MRNSIIPRSSYTMRHKCTPKFDQCPIHTLILVPHSLPVISKDDSSSMVSMTLAQPLVPFFNSSSMIIQEILTPSNNDDTHEYVYYISSFVGTMITCVFSSLYGFDITSSIVKVEPSRIAWTQPIYVLSTSLSPMLSCMISYPCISTSTSMLQPPPNDPKTPSPPFLSTFHCGEDIFKAITTSEFPWDAMYHHSFFLQEKDFKTYLWCAHQYYNGCSGLLDHYIDV